MVVHAFNLSTQQAETKADPCEFRDSQNYTEKPCLRKTKKTKTNQPTKQTNTQTNGPHPLPPTVKHQLTRGGVNLEEGLDTQMTLDLDVKKAGLRETKLVGCRE